MHAASAAASRAVPTPADKAIHVAASAAHAVEQHAATPPHRAARRQHKALRSGLVIRLTLSRAWHATGHQEDQQQSNGLHVLIMSNLILCLLYL